MDKKYIIKVVYEGYSGKTYTEELTFTSLKEAQKIYVYFAEDKSGCVKNVSFNTIDK